MSISIILSHNEQQNILKVSGTTGMGSGGNQDSADIGKSINDFFQANPNQHLLVDLSEMVYEFGDSIMGIFYLSQDHDINYKLNGSCSDAWHSLFNAMYSGWDDLFGDRVSFT